MNKSINFKELAKLREARQKKRVTSSPYLLPKSFNKHKMTISELIEEEKPYRINIEDIAKIAETYQQCTVQIYNRPLDGVWACSKCTYLNMDNIDPSCQICQETNYNCQSIQYLIHNKNLDGVFLYGKTPTIIETFNALSSEAHIQGKYYRTMTGFPTSTQILDSLTCIAQQKLDIREYVILIAQNNEITAFMLNTSLLVWLPVIAPLPQQTDLSHLFLERDVTIYEKGKMIETTKIDLTLFCYPIRIKG